MTFGMTLGEHLKMAASASMLHIAIDYKIKTNVKVAASNKTIKITQLFSKQWKISGDQNLGYTFENKHKVNI